MHIKLINLNIFRGPPVKMRILCTSTSQKLKIYNTKLLKSQSMKMSRYKERIKFKLSSRLKFRSRLEFRSRFKFMSRLEFMSRCKFKSRLKFIFKSVLKYMNKFKSKLKFMIKLRSMYKISSNKILMLQIFLSATEHFLKEAGIHVSWFYFFINRIQLWLELREWALRLCSDCLLDVCFGLDGCLGLVICFLACCSKIAIHDHLLLSSSWCIITPLGEWWDWWGRGSWYGEWKEIWVSYSTLANMCQQIACADTHDEGSKDVGDNDDNLKIDSNIVMTEETEAFVDTLHCFKTHCNASTTADHMYHHKYTAELLKIVHGEMLATQGSTLYYYTTTTVPVWYQDTPSFISMHADTVATVKSSRVNKIM